MKKVKNSEAYFKTEEIETFIGLGQNGSDYDDENNLFGERRKLIVLHQNGKNKKELIKQLKDLIYGLESNFEGFAG